MNVKLHLGNSGWPDLESVIPVFHDWVREQTWQETLIDVADYRHVPAGPGVILVGHEADFSLDQTGNSLGLRYNRKAGLPGSNPDRFRQALRSALMACEKLEEDPRLSGKLSFECREIELFINDRLLAPNDEDTFKSLSPEIREFCNALFGHGNYSIKHQPDPRKRFSVTVQTSKPINRPSLLKALSD